MKLVLEDVACERGGRLVLDGVTGIAEAGRALLITGPNGAGKSTLLRLVAGLLRAERGEIRLLPKQDDELATRAHYVGHADALKPGLTVEANLAFWRSMLGGEGDIDAALAAFGLETLADLPVSLLSAGQRRRLALARLLVAERPVWLLDEPTTALDRQSEQRLVEILRAHLRGGGIALVASHAEMDLGPHDLLALG